MEECVQLEVEFMKQDRFEEAADFACGLGGSRWARCSRLGSPA